MIRLWCCPAKANMITGFVSDTIEVYESPSLPPCWPGGNISCSPAIFLDDRATQTSGIQCDLGRMQPTEILLVTYPHGGRVTLTFFVVTSDRVSKVSWIRPSRCSLYCNHHRLLLRYRYAANRETVSGEITSHKTANKSSTCGKRLYAV